MPNCPCCGGARATPSYLGRAIFEGFEYQYLECAGCKSLFADPMPDGGLLGKIYGPQYLELAYGAASAECDGAPGGELAEAVALAQRYRPRGRVLDIGCGRGQFLIAAKRAGLRPEGLELTKATADLVARDCGVPVHSGLLRDLAGPFDAIHFADVLEHNPRPEGMLREIPRLLAPGGVVIARGPLENQGNLFQLTVRLSRNLRSLFGSLPANEAPPWHVILFSLEE